MKNLLPRVGIARQDKGFKFCTYAPGAKQVELQISGLGANYPMKENKGYWETHIEVAEEGSLYSFIIDGVPKADPFATKVVSIVPKEIESVIFDSKYVMKNKKVSRKVEHILEVYLPEISGRTYQEKVGSIVQIAKGYSHIQIMPFTHTPAEITLGYKTSSYFAPNSHFGTLDDFKEMIDMFHGLGLGVILDFVIFEFEEFSKKGLHNYDGQYLFNQGEGDQNDVFTGYLFDIQKTFVRDFLYTVVHFYIEELHADGIRIDGVNELIFYDRHKQEINKNSLKFLQELLDSVPKEIIILADLLTDKGLDELKLERIDYVEGSAIQFQVQAILKSKKFFLENRDKLIEKLKKAFAWVTTHRTVTTVNHDLHLDGFIFHVPNGYLDDPKDFELLKIMLFALPHPKQLYQNAVIPEAISQLIIKLKDATFSYEFTESNEIIYHYSLEQKVFQLIFNLEEHTLGLWETTKHKLI